ncbi:hypothetical protein P154DRAFT_578575 [Amniculicola lignicola CBS 123094]|uniref:Uncharacterized protein n=1 Tax=Amniculicola lignicola CBS 123094 TaxID=1392246 RepID=A0A6A5WCH4_9PLEO|nr:hypothetical protein P154DRAFT_578575 [Amniculicola lignicola CBS 123094]
MREQQIIVVFCTIDDPYAGTYDTTDPKTSQLEKIVPAYKDIVERLKELRKKNTKSGYKGNINAALEQAKTCLKMADQHPVFWAASFQNPHHAQKMKREDSISVRKLTNMYSTYDNADKKEDSFDYKTDSESLKKQVTRYRGGCINDHRAKPGQHPLDFWLKGKK